jgi:hypothetical protein
METLINQYTNALKIYLDVLAQWDMKTHI